jgi:hypothetical protein
VSEENKVTIRWERVIEEFHVPYMNFIDLGNYTLFRMVAFKTLLPRVGFYVGIEGRGNFYFGSSKAFHWEYVQEKLSLLEPDARSIADWMNAQLGLVNVPAQQGEYWRNVIEAVQSYGLIGEIHAMTWKPEIIV